MPSQRQPQTSVSSSSFLRYQSLIFFPSCLFDSRLNVDFDSQEITRSRDSPMYIPAEYAYVIPTLCLFFLLPPILDLSTPQRDASTAAESNWLPGTISALPYQIVCITGIVSFGIVLGYTPEPYDASRRLSIGEAMVPFLAMATLHLTPAHGRAALTRSRDAPDWLGVLVSGFCFGTKLAILIVGIYLMSLKPSQNISARQHDFHLLRSITQKEEHTLADATLDPREGGAYSDLSPAKITAGIILKTHFLLSGTCWFAHAQRTLLSWISVLQIDRRSHLSDLHDLCIGLAVLVITLGIVTSSRQMQGNQNIHSVGPAWSILGGASLVSAAVLIYLVQLLFGTWIDKEGSRGEWLLLKT